MIGDDSGLFFSSDFGADTFCQVEPSDAAKFLSGPGEAKASKTHPGSCHRMASVTAASQILPDPPS